MNRYLTLIILLFCAVGFCQERKALQGRVVSGEGTGIESIFVINKATGAETKTDKSGNFTIAVRAGDKIAVYGTKTVARDFAISEASFAEVPYVVSIEYKSYELEEVVVQGQAVSSESLGIVPKGQKTYTPAERKVYTATSTSTDALLNAISGRTKMLKKAVETEGKETVVAYLNGLYTDTEITAQFNIPSENVRAFIFYAADDAAVAKAVKGKNESLIKLLMIDTAKHYLAAIKE